MKVERLKELLEKYQSGQASKAERQLIETWYASFSKNKEQDPLANSAEKVQIRERIWSGIPIVPKIPVAPLMPMSRRTRQTRYLFPFIGAAAVMLVLGISIAIKQGMLSPNSDSLLQQRTLAEAVPDFVSSTGTKERKMVMLPDSTQVWLNANSTLKVMANYGDSTRLVQLSGEAFFDVAHLPAKPFIVELDDLHVKVLGTAFNINSYTSLNTIDVSVDRGAVLVEKDGVALHKLSLGQSLVFEKSKGTYALLERAGKGSWRDGKVVLTQASFEEMAQVIKNMHGVIVRKPANGQQTFSYNLTLYADRTLKENMDKIGSIHRLKYRRIDDEVVLY